MIYSEHFVMPTNAVSQSKHFIFIFLSFAKDSSSILLNDHHDIDLYLFFLSWARMWLTSPICAKDSLLHVKFVLGVSGVVFLCFLFSLFLTALSSLSSSNIFAPWLTLLRKMFLSVESFSQVSWPRPKLLRVAFSVPLYLLTWPLLCGYSSPKKIGLGIGRWLSPTRVTWPDHRSWFLPRSVNMLGMFKDLRTSASAFLSCHLMCSILRR